MAVLFWIFLDQICPKWIKLAQIGFLTNQKMLVKKVVPFLKNDKNGHFIFGFFWIRSVQNGSNLQIR